jgi:dTDP-4-dehydrorhamnose reductase
MKKIYIAGCGGMLGEAFYKQFSSCYELKCTDIDVNDDWLTFCDFRNLREYTDDVCRFKPDCLVHLGAYTDLEYCELHVDETYRTNTQSVENACYIANGLNIPLIYISTAGIFDGQKELYDDWDTPNPICHYARSKYAGEVFVEKNVQNYLILRAGWMMGGGQDKDKKFVQKIIKQIREGKEELFIVNDKLGTPTYTHDFAKNVIPLLEKELWGVYNMVCSDVTSRLEVAKEMLKILGLECKIAVNEVGSEYFQKDYFAKRPASERLVCKKLELRGEYKMRNWRVALKEYLHEYYQEDIEKISKSNG